jgi:hypothetical protein
MLNHRISNIYIFLRSNITKGLDTVHSARSFVEKMDGISENERALLLLIFENQSSVDDFARQLDAETKKRPEVVRSHFQSA